jgi:alpha-beta hydrolase superfamily lysophospholipase
MIAMSAVRSTSPLPTYTSPPGPPPLGRRRLLGTGLAALPLSLGGCVSVSMPAGPAVQAARIDDGAFEMADGVRLPYRAWLPTGGPPQAVILALHGMNDSRDAWEIPAPAFAAAGMAVYAPDQRGFGDAPGRGYWAGGDAMVGDARAMAELLRASHPDATLVLMGESMGGAVLMRLATEPEPPRDARYVLVAPAVWGRARMNLFLRATLWLAYEMVPGMTAARAPGVTITASDNRDALIRLSRDPLTIHETRVDAVKGLVDLMDAALAAAPRFTQSGLFLYGGRDELVPPAATAATWNSLPRFGGSGGVGPRIAYYPDGYHLLLRDLGRGVPSADVIAWIRDPAAPLPSGADTAALGWLARQS